MKQSPKVTLITPTYNQAIYLAETIESVLSQDYADIEYIVIDDGSTDKTPSVLERYANRVQCIRQENVGQARTLNRGWALATGKYLGYLSSDDVLLPSAIRTLVHILESDDSIACAFPDADLIDATSKVVKRNIYGPFDLEDLVVKQECHIGPGALFRRTAFETIGGWRPELRLAPDREFWIRLAGCGRFHFEPQSLAGYRVHSRSISYKDVSEETGREYLWVLDRYFDSADSEPQASILSRKSEAYGHATLILARNCLRAGKWSRGIKLYREACELHPPLSALSVKARLLRNLVSKPVRAALAHFRVVVRKIA